MLPGIALNVAVMLVPQISIISDVIIYAIIAVFHHCPGSNPTLDM